VSDREQLPRLRVDFQHGGIVDGQGSTARVWLSDKADRSRLNSYIQEQLDVQAIQVVEGLQVVLEDLEQDLPDTVGRLHLNDAFGWYADYECWTP